MFSTRGVQGRLRHIIDESIIVRGGIVANVTQIAQFHQHDSISRERIGAELLQYRKSGDTIRLAE